MKQKKKLVKKKVAVKKQKQFSNRIIIGVAILFICLFVVVTISAQQQSVLGTAQKAVSPTFGTIGDCHSNGSCPSGGVSPTDGGNTVSSTPITGGPAVSTSPCVSNDSVGIMSRKGKSRGNSGGGFFQAFIGFLQQLLQLLQQLLGGGTVGSPTNLPTLAPNPSGIQPSTSPSSAPSQMPCPTSATQPSGQQSQPTTTASSPAPTTPASSSTAPVGITGTWKLVFDDEFNGTSLNTKYWVPSWFNGGKINSNGTTLNPANVSISGGELHLVLASNSSGATINSDPKQVAGGGFQFGTGYVVESRIFIPGSGSAPYNWPAFWTDGQSWPTDGESDIFEGLGAATSNYHSPQGANNSGTIPGNWVNGWHTYALDREPGTDYIYWDGKLVRQYSSDDGGSPQYILLTVDCSGGCTTGSASTMNVDYVRVWQK